MDLSISIYNETCLAKFYNFNIKLHYFLTLFLFFLFFFFETPSMLCHIKTPRVLQKILVSS
jgi:hypothetical protein